MASYLLPFYPLEFVLDRNQLLQQYTGWLHTAARHMTTGDLHDDLVQEGYIAMWRAIGAYDPDKGALDYWLKRHATDRMRSIVVGKTMTTAQERKSTHGFTQPRGNDTRKRIAEALAASPNATTTSIAKALGMSVAAVSYQRNKMGAVAVSQNIEPKTTVSLNALMDVEQYGTGAGQTKRGIEFVPEELHYHEDLDGLAVAYHAGEIFQALDVLTPAQRKYVVARFWGGKTAIELRELFGYDPSSLWRDAKPRLQRRLINLRELVAQ